MKVTDRPVVVLLASVIVAFVAGIGTYEFLTSRVGDAVNDYMEKNWERLRGPPGPPGPAGVPIGTIIAWHQDLPGNPGTLPPGWIPCNGQTINDPESPLHGQPTPNLNPTGRFLRGGTKSGIEQKGTLEKHDHPVELTGGAHTHGPYSVARAGRGGDTDQDPNGANQITLEITGGGHTHTGNTEQVGSDETRPVNMSVVWIMRIR